MSEQKQTRLEMQNSILSPARVRRLTPDDLGITAPEQSTENEGVDDTDRQEDMREAAIEAAAQVEGEVSVGVAVHTADGNLYTGIPVEGDGWGAHAIELAVSKAVSDGAVGITSVAVYSDDGQSGLCGRCLQALIDTRDGDVPIEVLSAEGVDNSFALDELASWPSQI